MENSLYHSIELPGATLPGNLLLAPLAGYTDKAFREIAGMYGADFCYTEMVSAEAIARGNQKTIELMERGDRENMLGVQIFLSEADQGERALPGILKFLPSLIDINCGCPVPKVVKAGAGAALMQDPDKIYTIVRRLSTLTDVPVTVKIRSGWDESSINFEEVGKAAVEGGAVMIGIHARTRIQGYSGTAHWEHIAQLVDALPVPVIGSGDLFSPKAAANMIKQTKCAGVMFARGAIGNPAIFQRTRSLLSPEHTSTTTETTIDTTDRNKAGLSLYPAETISGPIERLYIGYRHLERTLHYKSEVRGCAEMKKHLSAYTKGLPNGAALRNELMRCTSRKCYQLILQEYLQRHYGTGLPEI